MKKTNGFSLLLILIFLNTACQAQVSELATATSIPSSTPLAFITATLPATQTPPASPTLAIPPSATSSPPIEGQTTTQVNVRNAPSAGGEQIGIIEIFAKVEIVGRDSSSDWWMILYPESLTGKGWVSAEFLQVVDASGVPVISIESINAPQVSTAVSSSNTGEAVSTSVPTQALAVASDDGDSEQNPAVNLTLSEISILYFEHSSDLSAPEGDAEDWVRFSLVGDAGAEKIVSVILDSAGSGKLSLALVQNGVV